MFDNVYGAMTTASEGASSAGLTAPTANTDWPGGWVFTTLLPLALHRNGKRVIRAIFIGILALAFLLIVAEPVAASPSAAPATKPRDASGTEDDSERVYSYVVQPGDALIRIAIRHDVSVARLAATNGLSTNDWVYVGQSLAVPLESASDPPSVNAGQADGEPYLPDPLPNLPLLPLEQPASVVPFSYARVVQENTPVFADPADAAQGLAPKRYLGSGYIWVSVQGKATYEEQDFFQINSGEYVRAEALAFYQPSTFRGVALAAQPERPFAWILKPVQPSLTPAGEANAEAPLYGRYDLVQIYATELLGDQVWYLIGVDQWINQIYVGKVTPTAPPEGVEPDGAWIDVNLFEQTLAAYQGDRMLYATLVSTGLPGWDTPTGLNRVWLRVAAGKMSGGLNRPDYYFLEDVPWTLYFDKDVALHTAYWHDGFGYKHSHGCVNLPPLDAQWLFDWAPDEVWVWVHAN
jgi:hypothetical protein